MTTHPTLWLRFSKPEKKKGQREGRPSYSLKRCVCGEDFLRLWSLANPPLYLCHSCLTVWHQASGFKSLNLQLLINTMGLI